MIRKLMAAGLLLCSFMASAQTLIEANMAWLTQHQEKVEVSLSSAEEENFLPALNTVILVWEHRDGALTAEISPYILKAMIAEPELTLAALFNSPASFNRWLSQLQGQVFMAVTPEQVVQLNDLKKALEVSLASYIIKPDSQFDEQAKRLLEQVQASSVYMVD
ncbi:hypothetical protein MGA5115_00837 [Marinomonas gallaica]|uniref:Uncharacterized protein n=1 Tax=Marinomonas gallaica TaxID=1806667 RepID=A0A1C3JNG6_9GAMM|nr:hypothetical protein [Marinomonas gallaica]SBT16753.1 hypothetical protein MGA5115_00837 [Marinomonas gallaica]SBT20469.1 hypothetical protein MGA5116_01055 [Marinomonas gallaica]